MDPLYGQKALAELCEYVVASLFEVAPSKRSPTASHMREGIDTPPYTPPLDGHAKREPPALVEFIAYALYRTRLPISIVHQSLLLLSRLKQRYPSARGTASSPHRLFLSALMLSAKISMDDTYSNKSWAIVGSNYFALKEVNQMERELFAFLGWNVVVSKEELDAFVAAAEGAFASSRPVLVSSMPASPAPSARSSPKSSQQSQLARAAVTHAHMVPSAAPTMLATPPMSCPASPQASTSTSMRASPAPSDASVSSASSSSRSSSRDSSSSSSKRQRRSSSQAQAAQQSAERERHQAAKNAARALLRPHTYRHVASPVSSRGSSAAPSACHSPATGGARMHPYALRSNLHQSTSTSMASSAFPSATHSPTSPPSAPLSAGPQTPITGVEGLHVHSVPPKQHHQPMHSAGLDFPEAAGYFAARA